MRVCVVVWSGVVGEGRCAGKLNKHGDEESVEAKRRARALKCELETRLHETALAFSVI